MTEAHMDERDRDLILAAEISGLIHDLGKIRGEFAQEKMSGGLSSNQRKKKFDEPARKCHQREAHGAILEEGRPYPPADEKNEWLKQIKDHDGWKNVLRIPEQWIQPGTMQAHGLGDPLRQHHAKNGFPIDQLTLLGDIYTFGADTRDSALDKGSGGTDSGKQKSEYGFIADSFGNENSQRPYGPDLLQTLWPQVQQIIETTLLAEGAWQKVPKTRKHFYEQIEPIFRQALGETHRPTNDVTLWHHSHSTASLFKAAVAEGVLRQDFRHLQDEQGLFAMARMGQIRFRLLGIRWDWAALAGGALQPVVLTALADNRRRVIACLRQRLEVNTPVGNLVYEDDNGAIFVVGGFYQGMPDTDGQEAEALFQERLLEPLQASILQALVPLGVGTTVRLTWTRPRLYLTDLSEVMAPGWTQENEERQRLLQVGENELGLLWAKQTGEGQQVQICPQCGLRPGSARERALNESGLNADDPESSGFCEHCQILVAKSAYLQRRREAEKLFGFEPKTFNLQEICCERNPAGNARVVMLSVRVNPENMATGAALLTQLARPLADLKDMQTICMSSAEKVGDVLENKILNCLRQGGDTQSLCEPITAELAHDASLIVGDDYWLDFQEQKKNFKGNDGRVVGEPAEKALRLLDEFFLREFIPADAGLYRHDGDKLLLFGMRKHASPGRLARIWDDLRDLWKQILWDTAGDTEHWLMPLSLDAGGFRLIVAADDARQALHRIQQQFNETLGKVRAGLDIHVSALAFRQKFPLYVALDALRRMERRIAAMPVQTWTLRSSDRNPDGTRALNWETEQGRVQWTVNPNTGDPDQSDLWYPHAICNSRPEGPGRLVRLDQLKPGETVRLRPSTFDFIVLEGTARRYDLRYDDQGRRRHFILGEPGRRPYLLEQLPELLTLASQTGWNASQTKGILGQVIECYEKWVRDVPAELRTSGRDAWQTHCAAIFRRYLKDQGIRDCLTGLLEGDERACLLFDAFEWSGFIEKDAHSSVVETVEP